MVGTQKARSQLWAIPKQERQETKGRGVYLIRGESVATGIPEHIYYTTYRREGWVIEMEAGRAVDDDMTARQASHLRSQRIHGARMSNKAMREAIRVQKESEPNRWTFPRLWAEYKARNPHVKELAIREYQWQEHLELLFGHKVPREVTQFELDGLRVKPLKSEKPHTVKHLLSLVMWLARFGKREGLCPGLASRVQLPKVDNEKTDYLTPDQVAALPKACDEDSCYQVGAIMKIPLFSGTRRSELFRLRWGDVGAPGNLIRIRDPEPGRSLSISMNAQARGLLENHPRESEFVFPGRNGKQRTDVTHEVGRIAEKARIPASVRPLHGLRHSFASWLASNSVDLCAIQPLLGHRSATMTARYSHLADGALLRTSDLAGRLVVEAANRRNHEAEALQQTA